MIETVEAPHGTVLRITAPLVHECPFKQETDEGSVTITWETEGRTFELHSLAAYLKTFAPVRISHEALTRHLKDSLNASTGLTVVSVATRWGTAGLDVACST